MDGRDVLKKVVEITGLEPVTFPMVGTLFSWIR